MPARGFQSIYLGSGQPTVLRRLRPKLLKDLKPGMRIVSNTFDMGDWKPVKELTLDDSADYGLSHRFFLWIVAQRKDQ
jgi:hypothetical protein